MKVTAFREAVTIITTGNKSEAKRAPVTGAKRQGNERSEEATSFEGNGREHRDL
jgi:hypothetical protein